MEVKIGPFSVDVGSAETFKSTATWTAHPGGNHTIYIETVYAGIDSGAANTYSEVFAVSQAAPNNIEDLTA